MFQLGSWNKASMVFSVMLLGSGLAVTAWGAGRRCMPPTPGPCSADGICRPSGEFGYNSTRWRPWPGDPVQRPTTADPTGTEEAVDGLEKIDLPSPLQEDLRGPAKKKKEKASGDDNATEDQAPQLEPELPEEFEFQGNLRIDPSLDDAPPALPNSLKQAWQRQRSSQRGFSKVGQQSQPQLAPVQGRKTILAALLPKMRGKKTQESQPASQLNRPLPPQGNRLINPAAALVKQPASKPLQQAVFYEATDQLQ